MKADVLTFRLKQQLLQLILASSLEQLDSITLTQGPISQQYSESSIRHDHRQRTMDL
jgi:hypothetical protein